MVTDIIEDLKNYCIYFKRGTCTAKTCRWMKQKDGKQICSCGGYLGEMEVRE